MLRWARRAIQNPRVRELGVNVALEAIDRLPSTVTATTALLFLSQGDAVGIPYQIRGGRQRPSMRPDRVSRATAGLYTGRLIYVKAPLKIEDLTGSCPPPNVPGEAWFRTWLGGSRRDGLHGDESGPGFSLLRRLVSTYDFGQGDRCPEPLRTLAHEYCHWRMLSGTSLAAVIDAVSWRLRLYQFLLCERFHQFTGIPRLSGVELQTSLKAFSRASGDPSAVALALDRATQVALWDLSSHVFRATFELPTIVSVMVEPSTWALLEPNYLARIESYLAGYFGDTHTASHQLAVEVLRHSMMFLSSQEATMVQLAQAARGPGGLATETLDRAAKAREALIDAVHVALDIPMSEWPRTAEVGPTDSDTSTMCKLVVYRFESALSGKQVEVAHPTDKAFASVIGYALRRPEPDDLPDTAVELALLKTALRVLRREREIFREGAVIATRWESQSAVVWPTVFVRVIVGDHVEKYRYDPLTGLTGTSTESPIDALTVKTTGRLLNAFDDLVGDLPRTMAMALQILYLQDAAASGDPSVRSIAEQMLEELALGFDLARTGISVEKWRQVLSTLDQVRTAEAIRASDMSRVPAASSVQSFVKYWTTLVLGLGEDLLSIRPEHGMWTL